MHNTIKTSQLAVERIYADQKSVSKNHLEEINCRGISSNHKNIKNALTNQKPLHSSQATITHPTSPLDYLSSSLVNQAKLLAW